MKMYIYVVHVYQTDDSDIQGTYSTLELAKQRVKEMIELEFCPDGNSDFKINDELHYLVYYYSESLGVGIEIFKSSLDDKVTYR